MEAVAGLLPIVLFILLFWLILIRPQQKRQKKVAEMQNNLQKGDEVVTIGGMHGRIHALDEGTIVVEVNEDNRLTYDRTAIREVKNQQ